jgi:hypothetical protein
MLKSLIAQAEKEARIDELERLAKKAPTYKDDYDIYPDIENRLAQLRKYDD